MKAELFAPRKERAQLYARYSKASDVPLFILALIMVPALLTPELLNLPPDQERVLEAVDWTIYAVFAADFLVKLYLAPSIRQHLRRNWIDVIVLALPLLRPIRLLGGGRWFRLLRYLRAATFGAEALRRLTRALARRGLLAMALITAIVMFIAALLVASFERGSNGTIKSLGDALWWAMTTVSTVGYGDKLPITLEGRIVAGVLMVMGVVFYGILTANLAAFFVESDAHKEDEATRRSLDEIARKLDAIEGELAQMRQEQSLKREYYLEQERS